MICLLGTLLGVLVGLIEQVDIFTVLVLILSSIVLTVIHICYRPAGKQKWLLWSSIGIGFVSPRVIQFFLLYWLGVTLT